MSSRTTGNLTLVIAAVGAALLALVTTVLVVGPVRLIRMPDGHWLLARTAEVTTGGRLHRGYVVGADMLVRQELDTDGDGVYDVRGDDWPSETPTWCWIRDASGWRSTTPAHCARAPRGLTTPPP